jgi:hypothetical protein
VLDGVRARLADGGQQIGGGLPVGPQMLEPAAYRDPERLERARRGRELELERVADAVDEGLAAQHEQGDVVRRWVGADQHLHDLRADRLGGAGKHRPGEPLQTNVERAGAALHQAVGVQAHRGAR